MALVYDTAYFALKDRGRIAARRHRADSGRDRRRRPRRDPARQGLGRARCWRRSPARTRRTSCARPAPTRSSTCRCPTCTRACGQQVFALTDNKGVDIVVDMLGGDIFDAAVRALAWCGRLIVIGFASGRIPSLKMNYVLVKNIEVSGMQISDYRKRRPADMQACFAEIYALHAAGQAEAAADQGLSDRAVRAGACRHQGPQGARAHRADDEMSRHSPGSRGAPPSKCDAFERQQLRLGGGAAGGGEAAELAARRQHAMAGDDDRHRVPPHRRADVARALRHPARRAARQLAVGHGRAEADARAAPRRAGGGTARGLRDRPRRRKNRSARRRDSAGCRRPAPPPRAAARPRPRCRDLAASRRSVAARIFSGSCTAASPRAFQATPQVPSAVSNR